MATNFEQVLESFLASDDFKSSVISATKASWGGSGYSVELFADGTHRVLWNSQIGNKYETPGVILSLPTISDDVPEEQLSEGFDAEEDELKDEIRERLNF